MGHQGMRDEAVELRQSDLGDEGVEGLVRLGDPESARAGQAGGEDYHEAPVGDRERDRP